MACRGGERQCRTAEKCPAVEGSASGNEEQRAMDDRFSATRLRRIRVSMPSTQAIMAPAADWTSCATRRSSLTSDQADIACLVNATRKVIFRVWRAERAGSQSRYRYR